MELSNIHHVSLSVRDLERSLKWYTKVLKLSLVQTAEGEEFSKAMLNSGNLTLVLVQHRTHLAHTGFSEFQPGLDHIGFTVNSPAELEQWAAHLDELGVEHHGITEVAGRYFLPFRDPDNIALELYAPLA